MTRLFLVLTLVFLAACTSPTPTWELTSIGPKDVNCINTLGSHSKPVHAIGDAFSSALSHPDDPSAIEEDMKAIQREHYHVGDSPIGIKRKAQLATDKALALMKQLQKDGVSAKTQEFEKEVKSIQDSFSDIITAIDDDEYFWCTAVE